MGETPHPQAYAGLSMPALSGMAFDEPGGSGQKGIEMKEEQAVEVLDQKTGEMTEKTPEDLLLAASEAAKALERVIQLNERPPLMFNGKRYLEFHHWQTIGAFYHVTTETYDPEPVEIDGVKGFKAKASVLDSRTGIKLGGAEAYCFRDEPNWKSKPLFQLASMAQTRAASKALANKFRFVAIVAGYEGTPSEEMIDGTPQRQVAMPRAKEKPSTAGSARDGEGMGPVAPEEPARDATVVHTEAEKARIALSLDQGLRPPVSKFFAQLHQLVRMKEIPDKKMKTALKILYNKESSKDLTDEECAELIKTIEKGGIR
jgi:hypothetical protein